LNTRLEPKCYAGLTHYHIKHLWLMVSQLCMIQNGHLLMKIVPRLSNHVTRKWSGSWSDAPTAHGTSPAGNAVAITVRGIDGSIVFSIVAKFVSLFLWYYDNSWTVALSSM